MPYSLYPHFTGDPYEKAFEFLDTVLLAAPEQTSFRYEDLIKESDLPQIEKDIARHINSHFRNLIQRDLKYIEPLPNDIWKQRLTSLGRSVKKAGGHFAYLEKQENNAAADAERQKRKDIIDEADSKIKPWSFRKRYLPYVFPFLALVTAAISIFISIKALNNNKPQKDFLEMKEQMKLLQKRMNRQDSLFRLDTHQIKHKQ